MRRTTQSALGAAALIALVCSGRAVEAIQHEVPVRLGEGVLQLEISFSRTAHLFHVVDQLAEWSEFVHRQYVTYFEQLDGGLSARDRELLARHAGVRAEHDWGEGLEQTFYTDADLESALRTGVRQGYLTQAEAEIEREVFAHFAARIDRLREEQLPTLEAFARRLESQVPQLERFAERVSRFFHGARLRIPVFLIANPHPRRFGGGYAAGHLTLEVPGAYDAYPTFLHEIFHAFAEVHHDEIEAAAVGVAGLDWMTLNEGMAYALSPGIFRPDSASYLAGAEYVPTHDPLLDRVRSDIDARKPLTDSYTRFNRLGLALRPLLKEALDDDSTTITTFLPDAVRAWAVVLELDKALRPPVAAPEK